MEKTERIWARRNLSLEVNDWHYFFKVCLEIIKMNVKTMSGKFYYKIYLNTKIKNGSHVVILLCRYLI